MNLQDLISTVFNLKRQVEEYRKGFPYKFVIFNIKDGVVSRKAIYGFKGEITGNLDGNNFEINSPDNELTYDGFALSPHRDYENINHTLSQVVIENISSTTGEFIIIWEAY